MSIELTPKNKYAQITRIAQITGAGQSYVSGGREARFIEISDSSDGTAKFILDGGLAPGVNEWYRVTVLAQDGITTVHYDIQLRGMRDDLGVISVAVGGEVNTSPIGDNNEIYVFQIPASEFSSDITITANDTVKIISVDGKQVIPQSSVWTKNGYPLSTNEKTTVTFVVVSELYVNDTLTPNAKKTYTAEIYRKSVSSDIGNVIVNSIEAIPRPGNPTIYEIAVGSGVDTAEILIRAAHGFADISMNDDAGTEQKQSGELTLTRTLGSVAGGVVNEYKFRITSSSGIAYQEYTLYVYRDLENVDVRNVYVNGTQAAAGATTNVNVSLFALTPAQTNYNIIVNKFSPVNLTVTADGNMSVIELSGYGIDGSVRKRSGDTFENLALKADGETVFTFNVYSADVAYANVNTPTAKSGPYTVRFTGENLLTIIL